MLKNSIVYKIFTLGFVGLSVFLSSCTEIIEVDLRDIDAEWVVQAQLAAGMPAEVVLTQSVNFDEKNEFPAISSVMVSIQKNNGETELLEEIASGVYRSKTTIGSSLDTYTLSIESDVKMISATETIPQKVAIDSVQLMSLGFSRPPVPGADNPNPSLLTLYFSDPSGISNYYKAVAYKGDSLVNNNISNDLLFDGRQGQISVFIPEGSFNSGDMIDVQLQSITKSVYDYYMSMPNAGRGPGSGSPANPITNLQGNKLGYFNAYSFSSYTIEFNL